MSVRGQSRTSRRKVRVRFAPEAAARSPERWSPARPLWRSTSAPAPLLIGSAVQAHLDAGFLLTSAEGVAHQDLSAEHPAPAVSISSSAPAARLRPSILT